MRIRNVKNKEEIIDKSKYTIKGCKDYCSKWQELFNNNNPIHIEIGMGKGKFIKEMAKANKDINFIGIEKNSSIVAKALSYIKDDLDNLYIININALEIDEVFNHEVSRIYLNFSDPWPKNRHHLRRLSSRVFLEKYESIFRNDKTIHMRTDNRDLYTYSLVSFSQFGYKLEKIRFKRIFWGRRTT